MNLQTTEKLQVNNYLHEEVGNLNLTRKGADLHEGKKPTLLEEYQEFICPKKSVKTWENRKKHLTPYLASATTLIIASYVFTPIDICSKTILGVIILYTALFIASNNSPLKDTPNEKERADEEAKRTLEIIALPDTKKYISPEGWVALKRESIETKPITTMGNKFIFKEPKTEIIHINPKKVKFLESKGVTFDTNVYIGYSKTTAVKIK